MNKFKVGDRVSVYGLAFGNTACDGYSATVTKLCDTGWIGVKCDDKHAHQTTDVVHPKQCRRLKPKKKPAVFESFDEYLKANRLSGRVDHPMLNIHWDLWEFVNKHEGKQAKIRVEVIDD